MALDFWQNSENENEMTSQPKFPDEAVEEYIKNLAQKFSLKIEQVNFTPNEELSEISRESGDSEWQWILSTSKSLVQIKISFLYPSYLSTVSFANRDDSLKGKMPTYFFFKEYLSKYLKAFDDVGRIDRINEKQLWKDNWKLQFEILEKHLKGDLGKVVDGVEWPYIEFNWEDYVAPEAADRIYRDQMHLIEEHSKKNSKSGWLYFLNFKRKK